MSKYNEGDTGLQEILYEKLQGQLQIVLSVDTTQSGINEGVAPLMKHTKFDDFDVYYEDTNHVYFYDSKLGRFPMISVTTLVGLYELEFNELEKSFNCARKKNYEAECLDRSNWDRLTLAQKQSRILKAWEVNNKMSTTYGSAFHMVCEYLAKYWEPHKIPEYIDKVIERTNASWIRGHGPLQKLAESVVPIIYWFKNHNWEILVEPLLVDMEIGVVGQSDLVMLQHESKEIWVLDYKTNKKKPEKVMTSYGNMTGFFKDFADTSYNHYCIQLSLYTKMLQLKYPDYIVKGITILWMNRVSGEIEAVEIEHDYWGTVIDAFRKDFIESGISTNIYHSLISEICS